MDTLPFDCIVCVLEYLNPLDLSRVALVSQVSRDMRFAVNSNTYTVW